MKSRLAIVSFVLALVAVLILLSGYILKSGNQFFAICLLEIFLICPVVIVLSITSFSDIKKNKKEGKYLAVAGLIICIFVFLFIFYGIKEMFTIHDPLIPSKAECMGIDLEITNVSFQDNSVIVRRNAGGGKGDAGPVFVINGAVIQFDCNPSTLFELNSTICRPINYILKSGDTIMVAARFRNIGCDIISTRQI
jgi:hypothetical protein